MKTILDIKKTSSNSHIFWEHALKSAVAFVGTFALLFFGPLFLDAKTTRSTDNHEGLGFIIVKFVLEHPDFQYGMSFLALIICNIILVRRNTRMKCVVGIAIDSATVTLKITSLYFKTVKEITIPLENLEYEIRTKTSDDGDKSTSVTFIDQRTTEVLGTIIPSHSIWSNQLPDIRSAIANLNELGIQKKVKSSSNGSIITWLFRR